MKNIALCCATGMSISMLVQRMKDVIRKKDADVTIEAAPVAGLEENIPMADIALLGPQVKYEQTKLRVIADSLGKEVAVIGVMDYNMMRGDVVLDKAPKLLERRYGRVKNCLLYTPPSP